MSDYRRLWIAGGCYFFTVNLYERSRSDLLIRHIHVFRASVCEVRRSWPFRIDAWVVLPDHLHCIWTLPEGDADFATRWRLIKSGFARRLPRTEWRSASRTRRGERGIWQRRYWEHAIRDDRDFAGHMDYVHFNPVKHGYAPRRLAALHLPPPRPARSLPARLERSRRRFSSVGWNERPRIPPSFPLRTE